MFENFTGQARRVLLLAHREAHRLGHDHVGTDHLLLGVLREGSGSVARLLTSLGVDVARLRHAAEPKPADGPASLGGPRLPITPSACRALDRARAEADRLHHRGTGPGHLLLGLLHERDGEAAQALLALNFDLDAVRAQLLDQPPEENRDVMVRAESRPGVPPAPLADPSPAEVEDLFIAVAPGRPGTPDAPARRHVSAVPLRVDRDNTAVHLRCTQLMLGALAGAVSGALIGGAYAGVFGMCLGVGVAAVRWRPLSGFAGALAGIMAASQHFGGWWPPLLGAVAGAAIGACLGTPAGSWPEPPSDDEPEDEQQAPG